MRKQEIEIGKSYSSKISNKMTTVRIDSKSPRGGWIATNNDTGREVWIKTAAKLRYPVSDKPNLADKLRSTPSDTVPIANHVIVNALAGTGKTTTIIEGLKLIKGMEPSITPSPQQQAIWDEMMKSQGVNSVVFCCFNKSIQQELESRVPSGCEAMTMHSLGFKAVQSAFGKIRPDQWRTSNIICEIMRMEFRDVRKKKLEVLNGVSNLVSLCKQNLVNAEDVSELSRLAGHYGIELNGNSTEIFDLVPQVIERSKDVDRDRSIHFDDMIWLPVVLGLHVPKADLLLVDEAQDLNRCQQALAKKAGKRLILVGDPKQAIYGFAGADAESMPRMFQELSQTEAGCVELPLTVTRRCGKAIVEEAKKLVPNFEAHESNGEGAISNIQINTDDATSSAHNYRNHCEDGDMVLCRVNAPLVSECFKFLRQGKKATIRGRDIGKGLIQTVQKLGKSGSSWSEADKYLSITDFVERLSLWNSEETDKENAKKNPSEQRLMALSDKYETLICFTEEASTVGDLIAKIEAIFSDKNTTGIQFSSIHKAKGLEANRVFILMPKDAQIPHPMAKTPWAIDQEWNLLYVAETRAIQELVYVS